MADTTLESFIEELVRAIDNAVDNGLGKAVIINELRYQIAIVETDGEIAP